VSAGTDITTLTVYNDAGQTVSNAPVTFGQVFRPGDVVAGAGIDARLGNGTTVPMQLDKMAAYPDGSLKHAVLTARIPSLAAGGTQTLILANAPAGSPGTPVDLAALLATAFDAVVSLNVGGVSYTASARQLLSGTSRTWLQGPLVSEWIVRGPLRTSAGTAHTHLQVTFAVRAYAGNPIQRVRVDVASGGRSRWSRHCRLRRQHRGRRQHRLHAQWHGRHQRSRWLGGLVGSDPAVSVATGSSYLRATRRCPI
jgi:hypothetical protein